MKTPSDYARSIRYAAMVTMIAAASAVQACSSDTIVAVPSSAALAPTSQPTSQPAQSGVFGTVTDDEGMPVAGVKVTLYRWPNGGPPQSGVTDSMGIYRISSPSGGGISVLAEKEGYESKWRSLTNPSAADFPFDLRIHRIK